MFLFPCPCTLNNTVNRLPFKWVRGLYSIGTGFFALTAPLSARHNRSRDIQTYCTPQNADGCCALYALVEYGTIGKLWTTRCAKPCGKSVCPALPSSSQNVNNSLLWKIRQYARRLYVPLNYKPQTVLLFTCWIALQWLYRIPPQLPKNAYTAPPLAPSEA